MPNIDYRCACECPVKSEEEIAVYVSPNIKKASEWCVFVFLGLFDCSICEKVVSESAVLLCPMCQCTFEVRNVFLIRVGVRKLKVM